MNLAQQHSTCFECVKIWVKSLASLYTKTNKKNKIK